MMLKSKPIKQIFFIFLGILVLTGVFVITQAALIKALKGDVSKGIALVLKHNSEIKSIHYNHIAKPWSTLWHKRIALEDVTITLKQQNKPLRTAKLSIGYSDGFSLDFSDFKIPMQLLNHYMDQENKTKPMPIFLTHPSTVKISIANTAQMMIQLPSGSHQIPLQYLPPGYHTLAITIIDNATKKQITTAQSVYIAPHYLAQLSQWLASASINTLELSGSITYQHSKQNLDINLETKAKDTQIDFNSHYSKLSLPADFSLQKMLQALLSPQVENNQLSFDLEQKITKSDNPLIQIFPSARENPVLKKNIELSVSCAQNLQQNQSLLFSCDASAMHLGSIHALFNLDALKSNWLVPMLLNKGNTINWSKTKPKSLKLQYQDHGLIAAMLDVLNVQNSLESKDTHQAQLRWQQAIDSTLSPLGPKHYQPSAKAILAHPKDYILHIDLQSPQDKTIEQLQALLEQRIQNTGFGSDLALEVLRVFKVKIYSSEIISNKTHA